MSFADFPESLPAVRQLQRSLERSRVAHAYLFSGGDLLSLDRAARTLAKILNCQEPVRAQAGGSPIDSCDECAVCRRIEDSIHPDIHWLRPESKTRVITVEQMRGLLEEVHLKPGEARHKMGIIVAADRLNVQAGNAFLKTLEEPPPRSVLILLSTQPQRLLETIYSRCLRLNFGGDEGPNFDADESAWLKEFAESAATPQKSLMQRYRLLGSLMARLARIKSTIETNLKARSPLERYDEVDAGVRDRWEEELEAAVEAEYRRQRAELLGGLQWWLRDVWLRTLAAPEALLQFPQLEATAGTIAHRISSTEAQNNLEILEQTQRLLHTNVQEALALEVGMLKLKL